jgi:hypothetical protein
MVRKLLTIFVFALGMFVLLEFSYRLIIIGPSALNLKVSQSFVTLRGSPYIKPSQYPDVYYELKPNLDVLLRGVRLKTNSSGLADREYSLEKPLNTYRIAIVGSSWTMPASVLQQESYHFLLEESLNARSSDTNFEVINFAVEEYGLGEIVGTLRHRVMQYHPDLIIMAVTTFTSQVWWENHEEAFDPPVKSFPIFQSMILGQLGLIDSLSKADYGPSFIEDYRDHSWRRRPQISSAIWQGKQIADSIDSELAFLFLSFQNWFPATGDLLVNTTKMLDVDLINGGQALVDGGGKYKVSKYDLHPNPDGHKVLADRLMSYLQTKKNLGLN